MSFFALVTAVSGLPCSSSTMNLMSAPPSLLFFSSRYILKPSTMSLPTWANTPVVGARKPIRTSSDFAVAVMPSATLLLSRIGPSRRSNVLVIVLTPTLSRPRLWSGGRGCQFLRGVSIVRFRLSLPQPFRNAHQPGRQVEDRCHVNHAQHVLPPRHQR